MTSNSSPNTYWAFAYDANGIRTSRTNGSTTYMYHYDGGQLTRVMIGNTLLEFTYDASGTGTVVNSALRKEVCAMKTRMVLSAFLAVMVLLVLMSGCQQKTYSYPFTQDLGQVVSVEIRKYDFDARTTIPVLTLDKDTRTSLLMDIASLDSYQQFGDYPRDAFSEIVVYVSYGNGEAEVIGIYNTARVDLAGKWWVSSYRFDEASWCEMISKYIDADRVAS